MSAEAKLLAEVARDMLAEHERRAGADPWQPLIDGGWLGVRVEEADGGSGGTLVEAAALAEAAGASGASVPVTEAVLAALLIGRCADAAQLLAPLASGAQRATVACGLARAADAVGRTATLDPSGWTIPWARDCTTAVVPLELGGGRAAIALLDCAALELELGANVAGEPRDRVLPGPPLTLPLHELRASTREQEGIVALLSAARLLGAMRSAQRLSVEYANQRRQFGRSIGSFQAVAHALVRQAGEVEQSAAAVGAALAGEGDGGPCAAARVVAGDAAGPVAAIAHQVHGAVGTTHEHELHRFTLRLMAWPHELGAGRAWSRRLGEQIAQAGKAWLGPFDAAAARSA